MEVFFIVNQVVWIVICFVFLYKGYKWGKESINKKIQEETFKQQELFMLNQQMKWNKYNQMLLKYLETANKKNK